MSLNNHHLTILRALANEPGDGHMKTVWVAELCGHAYDTPWAAGRLSALAKRGMVTRLGGGWWKIADAGRIALSPPVAGSEVLEKEELDEQ
jgi:hypothetical protein